MNLALLAFAGVCTAWITEGAFNAQAILGDNETRVIGDGSRVPGGILPTVTRKLTNVNGVDCEWGSPHGRCLLIKT